MPPRPPGPRRAHDCIMEKAGNEKLPAHNIVGTGAAEFCDEPLPRLFLAAIPEGRGFGVRNASLRDSR